MESLLKRVGVEFRYEENWVGEGADRHPESDRDNIRQVWLPFTPEDWWHLTTRDGDDYVGGCCGNMGAQQDILCGVYRDSGWVDGRELLEIGHLGETHDGTEWWEEEITADKLEERIAGWDGLDRWTKIGVIYQACRAKLRAGTTGRLARRWRRPEPEQDAVATLRDGLRYLQFEEVFGARPDPATLTAEAAEFEQERAVQKHGNRQMLFARIVPAARQIVDILTGMAGAPFEGFCVVEAEDREHVVSNGRGLCFYETADKAQKMIAIWAKSAKDGDAAPPQFAIRPCVVSMEHGLRFTDGG